MDPPVGERGGKRRISKSDVNYGGISMVGESGPSSRVENVSPNPNEEFFKSPAPRVVRDTTPKGAVCIGVHRAEVWYIVV